jgi:hypothetical protein
MIKYDSPRYKKFFFRLLLFSAIGWVCLHICVYFLFRPQEWFWIYDTIEIKEKIASHIPGPKIVFVGGSATLFGVRTEDIEKELKIPTVNYGVHAALEIDYILDRAKKILKPGDTIILSLEYNHLLYEGSLNEVRTKFVLLFDKNYYHSLPFFDKIRYLIQFSPLTIELSIRSFVRGLMGLDNSPHYQVNTLNKNGDETNNLGNDLIKNKYNDIQPITVQKGDFKETIGLKVLDNFNQWSMKNNIKFFVTYAPTILYEVYNGKEFREYFNNLQAYFKKHNIKTIGSPEDFFYRHELFYDTIYHLNSEGMTCHTQRLLSKMAGLLQTK